MLAISSKYPKSDLTLLTTCTATNHSVQAIFISWWKYSNNLLTGFSVSSLARTIYSQTSSHSDCLKIKFRHLSSVNCTHCPIQASHELTSVTSMASFPIALPLALSTSDTLVLLNPSDMFSSYNHCSDSSVWKAFPSDILIAHFLHVFAQISSRGTTSF